MTNESPKHYFEQTYPGYIEFSANQENFAVREYFDTTPVHIPKFFILENPNPPRPGRLQFVKKLLGTMIGLPIAPHVEKFARNSEFFGKYDDERGAFFLRENSPYAKKHELVHFYTDEEFPDLIKTVAEGYEERTPTDKPFVYNFVYEGIAELIATGDGLNKTGTELEEAQKWANFRLTGKKVTGDATIDQEYLLTQFEKAKAIIEKYKKRAINPESLLRRDQFHKTQDALRAEPNSKDSSTEYSLGYAYCLAHFRRLTAEGKSKKEAIREILQSPPENLNQIKEAIEQLQLKN